jgi:hypothetical protein
VNAIDRHGSFLSIVPAISTFRGGMSLGKLQRQ